MTSRNPKKTRERLLQSAFAEIHAHGFQGMRVDEVLRHSGLQKGAFYHHFGSKTELGYAVLEEQIKTLVEAVWLAPLAQIRNPVVELPSILDGLNERIPPAMREHGCPLNNLAQEMGSQDEGFRQRIATMFSRWIAAIEELFEQAKADGYVRADIDSQATARFVVAALEGSVSLFKIERSPEQWLACRSQLSIYLQTLGPVRNA